ncbi:MAG: hypothetical protein HY287_12745 [Planctomycetes bacterium]|nr:hypothetical protein [Planctomycetota bacterium]MBI3835191.1 hypothetical protein [Planctomycetota bacterium]
MARKLSRLAAVGMFSVCTLLSSGCSLSSLGTNTWAGFGYGLGGIPGQIIGNLIIAPLLAQFLGTGTTTT